MDCRISIIVPVFNSAPYLKQCLDSLTIQTIPELEILCVDDHSEDNSRKILGSLAAADPRIKVIELPENHGAGYARNQAMQQAAGDYIAFIDADDFLPGNRVYELLTKAAEDAGLPVAGGNIAEFKNNEIEYDVWKGMQFVRAGTMTFNDWGSDYGFTRFVYRRDFLLQHHLKFPEVRYYEDPPFLVETLCAATKFQVVPDYVYCYRRSSDKTVSPGQLHLCLTGMRNVLKTALDYGQADKLKSIYQERLADFSEDALGWLFFNYLDEDHSDLLRLMFEIGDLLSEMPAPLRLLLSNTPVQQKICRWFTMTEPDLTGLWDSRIFTAARYLVRPGQIFRCLMENGSGVFKKIHSKKASR